MYNLREMLGKEFVETTLNDLNEKGHKKCVLKDSLSCIAIIFEWVDKDYIESYINAPNDILFNRCAVYLENRFGLYYASTFDKLFNRINNPFETTKPQISPNDTFVELFRICYERRKQLRK